MAKINSAIDVMKARSQTTGEPYEMSYDQLARMIDFSGKITRDNIESAINSNPGAAGDLNFGEDSIEVDANAPANMGNMGNMGMTPTPGMPNGEGPDVSGQPLGQDMMGGDMTGMTPNTDMTASQPVGDMTGAPPPEPQINQTDIVKQLATSAKNRRLK